MAKKPPTYKIEVGRDSKNGQFISVSEAHRRPSTTEVQHIKIPRDKGK